MSRGIHGLCRFFFLFFFLACARFGRRPGSQADEMEIHLAYAVSGQVPARDIYFEIYCIRSCCRLCSEQA